uniref:Uncharacterized protein n=1 Tax=viral metagenome TaxID=1070528 RepID=A0A6M3K6K6_9ZZZZ
MKRNSKAMVRVVARRIPRLKPGEIALITIEDATEDEIARFGGIWKEIVENKEKPDTLIANMKFDVKIVNDKCKIGRDLICRIRRRLSGSTGRTTTATS